MRKRHVEARCFTKPTPCIRRVVVTGINRIHLFQSAIQWLTQSPFTNRLAARIAPVGRLRGIIPSEFQCIEVFIKAVWSFSHHRQRQAIIGERDCCLIQRPSLSPFERHEHWHNNSIAQSSQEINQGSRRLSRVDDDVRRPLAT